LKVSDKEKQLVVLLVENDKTLAEVVRECLMLQSSLFVEIALSCDDAFKMMEKIKPDVIVSSLQMRKDPFIFLKELRERGNVTPFIALIADDQNDLALEAIQLGANGSAKKFGDPSIIYPQLKRLIMSLTKPFDNE
jgi:DNA-binding NarL/FixJ family response regulator